MLELVYIYGVILACLFVVKTLSNDPEKEKIWGKRSKDHLLAKKDNEIELLKRQLEHFRRYTPVDEEELIPGKK